MKLRILAAAAALLVVPAPSSAATDTTATGQGNGKIVYQSSSGNVTCNAPVAITLQVRSNNAVVVEEWAPGSPGVETCAHLPITGLFSGSTTPPVKQCVNGPVSVTIFSPSYTLTQVGSKYTLRSSSSLCNGTTIVDLVEVTVSATQIVYSHTYTVGGAQAVKGTATIPRLA